MIYHTVLFKLKPDVEKADKDMMIAKLNSLRKEVPRVQFLNVAYNFSDRSGGHDIVLVSGFDNELDFNTYAKHPYHVSTVAEFVKPYLESTIVGDIEV